MSRGTRTASFRVRGLGLRAIGKIELTKPAPKDPDRDPTLRKPTT